MSCAPLPAVSLVSCCLQKVLRTWVPASSASLLGCALGLGPLLFARLLETVWGTSEAENTSLMPVMCGGCGRTPSGWEAGQPGGQRPAPVATPTPTDHCTPAPTQLGPPAGSPTTHHWATLLLCPRPVPPGSPPSLLPTCIQQALILGLMKGSLALLGSQNIPKYWSFGWQPERIGRCAQVWKTERAPQVAAGNLVCHVPAPLPLGLPCFPP